MEWISVKDRTPPKDRHFMAYDGEFVYIADWMDRGHYTAGWICCCCNGCCSIEPTYWAELPEAPKDNHKKEKHNCISDLWVCSETDHGELLMQGIGLDNVIQVQYCPFCGFKGKI